jgi:hypothetical protein
MLAAWAWGGGETGGNIFLLCRSTAFKITFEESLNKCHSVGLCCSPRAKQIYLQKLQKTSKISPNIGNLNTLKPTWSTFFYMEVLFGPLEKE